MRNLGGITSTTRKNSFAERNYRISTIYSPYIDAKADIDPNELNGGVKFNHNLDSGHGTGLKLSFVNNSYRDSTVLSIAYYLGKQKENEMVDYLKMNKNSFK